MCDFHPYIKQELFAKVSRQAVCLMGFEPVLDQNRQVISSRVTVVGLGAVLDESHVVTSGHFFYEDNLKPERCVVISPDLRGQYGLKGVKVDMTRDIAIVEIDQSPFTEKHFITIANDAEPLLAGHYCLLPCLYRDNESDAHVRVREIAGAPFGFAQGAYIGTERVSDFRLPYPEYTNPFFRSFHLYGAQESCSGGPIFNGAGHVVALASFAKPFHDLGLDAVSHRLVYGLPAPDLLHALDESTLLQFRSLRTDARVLSSQGLPLGKFEA